MWLTNKTEPFARRRGMRREWLIVFMFIATGGFTASVSMADIGDVAWEKAQALVATGHNSGNTSGTILNPEGRGDVLIFPYYDVREVYGKTQDFYFAIINDDSDCDVSSTVQCNAGMAARLRFREWEKGEEVFSTDIWLSRGDVWVGMLTHNISIVLPYGARITSPDWVIIDSGADSFTLGTPLQNGFDFPNTAYIPGPINPPYPLPVVPGSPGSSNLMGYFEVIGEERTYDQISTLTGPKVTRLTGNADAPNHLMGYAYIVRVADGSSFAYNATAIANFSRNKGSLFSGVGLPLPTLMDCEDTLDQLEFQLSKKGVFAGYSVEDVIAGKFSLILTFPTKHYHFCGKPGYTIKGDPTAPCAGTYPLGSPFNPTFISYGYFYGCLGRGEEIVLDIYDRNENKLTPPVCFLATCPPFCPPGLPGRQRHGPL